MTSLLKFLKKTPYTFTIIVALLTFVIGWQLGHFDVKLQWQGFQPSITATNEAPPQANQNIDFKLFWEVWNKVSQGYVDKKAIDPQKMYYGAIKGMVEAIGDPYTMFLPPAAQKSTSEDLGGSFEGVGIELGYDKDKRLVVQSPLDGSPASKAGIKAGDFILKVNNKDISNLELPDVVNLIRGPKGTSVNLDIYHEGDDKDKTVTLQRDTIIVKSAIYSDKTSPKGKKISYIKLTRFGERTLGEWDDAVSQTLASGSQGLVLDLRNNPGGFLQDAVTIGSEFIDKGNIVLQEDGSGQRQGYPVNKQGRLLSIPMVVLINKGSASASEIVSGAIQDTKRGKLVGSQSFGKGTIQDTEELEGGTGLHITKAKWLTPNGRWIHQIGLTPDVKVEASASASNPNDDNQLDTALEQFDQ